MNKRSISQSRTDNQASEPNEILKQLANYYKVPTSLVINHLYEKFNYSYADVAKILHISYQRVQQIYPKPKKEGSK